MRSRYARRALCLCAVLLGLTAFSASSAYGAGWMLEGHELEEKQLPTVVIRGHGTLLFLVTFVHVKILCTGSGTVGAHLVWGIPPVRLLGKLKFLNCTIKIVTGEKEETLACKPHSPGAPAGTIETTELEGELTLVEKQGVVAIKSKNAEGRLMTIETEECALPELIPIFGTLALKDAGGTSSLETEAKVHTLEEGPGTAMYAVSNTAEHKTTLGGKFEAELESVGKWSGLPG